MSTQTFLRFKRLTIATLAMAGFGMVAVWGVPADAADQVLSDQKQKAPAALIIALSAAQKPDPQETGTLPEGQKSESQKDEKGEAAAPRQKSLRDFTPSEQIEAEQAVDFPYDI
jgi:hypothetical protein